MFENVFSWFLETRTQSHIHTDNHYGSIETVWQFFLCIGAVKVLKKVFFLSRSYLKNFPFRPCNKDSPIKFYLGISTTKRNSLKFSLFGRYFYKSQYSALEFYLNRFSAPGLIDFMFSQLQADSCVFKNICEFQPFKPPDMYCLDYIWMTTILSLIYFFQGDF
jgi:hypothetical protein